MKAITIFPDGTLVTGSKGFIGSSLCAYLASLRSLTHPVPIPLDLRREEEFKQLLHDCRPSAVVHLAGRGDVLLGWKDMAAFYADTVDSAVNILDFLSPNVFIFSSSCVVYGNTKISGASANPKVYRPQSAYALSKIAVELICSQWAAKSRQAAVIFRFGNVVGKGCGGLIPYLIRHALHYPQGEKPARLRGAGKIVRDYVPLHYVNQILSAAIVHHWRPGSTTILNLGTGRGLTNGAVAACVADALSQQGYQLRIEWDPEPAPGETSVSVLNTSRTERIFGIPAPSPDAVWDSIDEAIRGHLEDAGVGLDREAGVQAYRASS